MRTLASFYTTHMLFCKAEYQSYNNRDLFWILLLLQLQIDIMKSWMKEKPMYNAKYVTSDGEVLTKEYLNHTYPHIEFVGEVGRTGLLGRNKDTSELEIYIRHPDWIPQKNNAQSVQTTNHIMRISGRIYGEKVASVAAAIISEIKEGKLPSYGALKIGKEIESFAIDALTGEISEVPPEEQVEFQSAIHEEAMPPYNSIEEAVRKRTEQIITRARNHPGLFLMDTSVPMTGTPMDWGMGLNRGKSKDYVYFIANKLLHYIIDSDTAAIATNNAVAHHFGFKDYKDMLYQQGLTSIWPVAAGQTSYGMPHVTCKKNNHEEDIVPIELMIAVADMFNSTVGAVSELLTASSPLLFGLTPYHNEQKLRPRDYRMILRYMFETAWPGPSIHTNEELEKRWELGIKEGFGYTIDRMSFHTNIPGRKPSPVFYGTCRIRLETKHHKDNIGRIENTLSGATMSLLDEIAHDSLLYLLAVAAFEAVAAGMHPFEYIGDTYPHIKLWHERKELAERFNFYGGTDTIVNEVLHETIDFLRMMDKNYPILSSMIQFTIARIDNLRHQSANTLTEYQDNPIGPISDVILKEFDSGKDAYNIAKELVKYQMNLAHQIGQLDKKVDFYEQLIKLSGTI